MKTKKEIVDNWLVRYTGVALEDFGNYILLTNFQHYVDLFAQLTGAEVQGQDKSMSSATHNGITMINFGMGSPNAATIMDLLSAIEPKAVLFLGKCGGLKKRNSIGDFILPLAPYVARVPQTITSHRKYRQCLHLLCKRPYRLLCVITTSTIGQVLSTPPTAECGSLTTSLKNTCWPFVPMRLIWKPLPHRSEAMKK